MNDAACLHRPEFGFRVNGVAASKAFHDALTGWRLAQSLSQPSSCELQFSDPVLAELTDLCIGARVMLDGGDNAILFDGEISMVRREKGVAGAGRLVVCASDKLERLRRRQATAAHPAALLSETVSSIAGEIGLAVESYGADCQLPLKIQWGASDLDWLTNICAAYGHYLYLDGDVLKMMSLEGDGASVELDIDEDVFNVAIDADAVGLRTEATAYGWNPLTGDAVNGTAMDFSLDVARVWRGAPAEIKEVARDLTGGASALGENAVSAFVSADLDRAAKRAHRISAEVEGDTRLRPGVRVLLKDRRDEFADEFVLTQAVHSYAAESGYVCEISSAPPPDPTKIVGPAISLGVISDTDDPQNAGRVRVALTAFNELQSDWLFVCSLGAGAGKGFIVQPEVGDQVLVAFAGNNPAQGVVLGGIFGAHHPHDGDVGSSRPRPISLRTADGQLLRLDDHAGAARLQSRGGELSLDPAGVVLRADADLRIEAPGRRITITADKIDFKNG